MPWCHHWHGAFPHQDIGEDIGCSEMRGTRGIRRTTRPGGPQRRMAACVGQFHPRKVDPKAWFRGYVDSWINRLHSRCSNIPLDSSSHEVLPGHGCLRQYLHRSGNAGSSECPDCTGSEKTTEHVLFIWPHFRAMRDHMLWKHNSVQMMCSDEFDWRVLFQRLLPTSSSWSYRGATWTRRMANSDAIQEVVQGFEVSYVSHSGALRSKPTLTAIKVDLLLMQLLWPEGGCLAFSRSNRVTRKHQFLMRAKQLGVGVAVNPVLPAFRGQRELRGPLGKLAWRKHASLMHSLKRVINVFLLQAWGCDVH